MIATRHAMLTHPELVVIARQLKMPLKHVSEYHRFMHGHETTKLEPSTKRFINDKLSLVRFRLLDKAVGLQRKSLNLPTNQ